MVNFAVSLLVVVLFLVIVFLIIKLGARMLGIPLSPDVLQIIGLILLLALIIYVVYGVTGLGPAWHLR
jgi:hypothetical protein